MLCVKESYWAVITSILLSPQLSKAHSPLFTYIYFTGLLMYNSFNYRVRETESCMDQVSAAAVNHKRERQRESEWERERQGKKKNNKGKVGNKCRRNCRKRENDHWIDNKVYDEQTSIKYTCTVFLKKQNFFFSFSHSHQVCEEFVVCVLLHLVVCVHRKFSLNSASGKAAVQFFVFCKVPLYQPLLWQKHMSHTAST